MFEYNDIYRKATPGWWQYYTNKAADNITGSIFFKLKPKFFDNINNDVVNVEISVPLKYLIFGELLKCQVLDTKFCNLWRTFTVNDTNLYRSVKTLSTQDNAKLLEQLKLGFKRTINSSAKQRKLAQFIMLTG